MSRDEALIRMLYALFQGGVTVKTAQQMLQHFQVSPQEMDRIGRACWQAVEDGSANIDEVVTKVLGKEDEPKGSPWNPWAEE